jgi:hypothetical protein
MTYDTILNKGSIMSLKKITSLTMLLGIFVMAFTGILLFITPPGRVANWTNWEIFGMSKGLIGDIHSTFMVLFIIATILHIVFNLRPMISYMKNTAREFVLFTKEMIVAIILTLIFLLGTIYEVTPFSTFLDFGTSIKNSWEKSYSTAPYSHAELSSLKEFSKNMNYKLEDVEKLLSLKNIIYEQEQTLSSIAKSNDISPNRLFDIIVQSDKQQKKNIPLSGLGKKTVSEIAETLGITTEEFISRLDSIGLKVSKNDKFKEVVEQKNLTPMSVLEKLGFKGE